MRGVLARIAGAVAVLFFVTFIAFALSYLSPTDAATRYFTDNGVSPSEGQLAQRRSELGIDRPFIEQYASWVASLARGDLGVSYQDGRPVAESLLRHMPFTLALAGASLAATLIVALPLALLCARRKGGAFDNAMRVLTYLLCSLPSFFVALVLLYVLSARLHVLPVRSTPDALGLVMPAASIVLPLSAWYVRQFRAIALEQLSAPYVDGLRLRGVSELRILFCHVLRNSLVPLFALIGLSAGTLLGGTAIVESIFSWPGMGGFSVDAIGARDYPVVQAYALLMALVYLAVNVSMDAASRMADPRMRKAGR